MMNLTGLFVAPVIAFGVIMGAIGFPSLAVDTTTPHAVKEVVAYDTQETDSTENVQYASYDDGYLVKAGDNHYFVTSEGEMFHVPSNDPALEGVELTETVKR